MQELILVILTAKNTITKYQIKKSIFIWLSFLFDDKVVH